MCFRLFHPLAYSLIRKDALVRHYPVPGYLILKCYFCLFLPDSLRQLLLKRTGCLQKKYKFLDFKKTG